MQKINVATKLQILIFAIQMKWKLNWDALGVTTTVACAIHCAVVPLLVSTLPVLGINIVDNPAFEYGMIALALIIGITALWHGFRKHHHSFWPIALFVGGILFLVAKQFWHQWQLWFLIPAVLLIVSAHFINYRFCRVHNHAHTNDCNH
ncbi:MAG: hypothetical protein RLZZ316_48 [Bacteroidota bacterium]